ncbi:MAG: HU family DNA-binding protein [Prevotella sp.]|nr:HU family DNA-binding protein [Prevotella sp.]
MAKSIVQDLARYISVKRNLSQKDAEQFVKQFFDIVGETLEQDPLVKVKGLGTFKIIDVKDRESVDVNTGERIVIEGRSKISFTPDNVMKELVNKPFSQFETVVINEGVEFPEEEKVQEEPTGEAISKFAEIAADDSSDNSSDNSTVEPTDKLLNNPSDEPISDSEEESYVVSAAESVEEDKPLRWPWILALVATAVVMFCVGYFVGQRCSSPAPVVVAEPIDTIEVADTATVDTMKTETVEEVSEPAPKQDEVSPAMQQAMNIVATGAYIIEGTQEEVVVRPGQTISKISKHYLGDGLESYVIVHNGVTEVKEGMTIKIPKLKVKKKKKQ